jgi:hypothetical protein
MDGHVQPNAGRGIMEKKIRSKNAQKMQHKQSPLPNAEEYGS